MRIAFAAMLALVTLCPQAEARPSFRIARRGSAITLRRRLHVNSLITEPGTLEVEWNNTLDISSDWDWTMPSTIKYTPEGKTLLWGRTEYSSSFDGIQRDRVTFAANTLVFDGEHFDVAVQPQTTFPHGDDTGIRAGATAIGRFDWGRNSAGLSLGWSGATVPSPTNPAGILDFTSGLGRHVFGPVTVHSDLQIEKQTGFASTVSLFEGFEVQLNNRVAIDVSAQHYNLKGGTIDLELVIGVTANFGRIPRR